MALNRRTVLTASLAALSGAALAAGTHAETAPAATAPAGPEFTILLYPGFETIDALGPAEMLGYIEGAKLRFVSLEGGVVKSAQGVPVMTEALQSADKIDRLVVPGAAPNFLKLPEAFFATLKTSAEKAEFVLTVCTGSLLLARTGLLDGKRATSNKKALLMVMKAAPKVQWRTKARWVVDGRFYTSSGITAGMDMALGFIADQYGIEKAKSIAAFTEYRWENLPEDDVFGF